MKHFRNFFAGLYALSWLGLALGFFAGSESFLAASTVSLGLGYVGRDYSADPPDSVTVMTVYAFFGIFFFGLGNLIGFNVSSDAYDAMFNKYNVPEFHFQAQMIASLGQAVPLAVYDVLQRIGARRPIPFPSIGFEVSDRSLLIFALAVLGAAWVTVFGAIDVGGLGTAGGFVSLGSLVAIFLLQSRWLTEGHTLPVWSRWIPAIVMVVDATYNAMFRSLRVTVLWPIVAFCLPFVLRKKITPVRLALSLVLVGLFVLAFKPLGELRGRIYGGERLTIIAQQSPFGTPAGDSTDDATDPGGVMTLLARLSTYNQLSQVVRMTNDDGFYDGETLSYITYAFIPRFVWPDKPLITPGQWFAAKLGKGQYLSGNQFSNAINMTIPGEFFLNFGWTGVILGLVLEGLLYYLYWQAAGFHRGMQNPLGQSFSCVALMQAAFNGSDVAALVTLTVWYILYLALTRTLGAFMRRRRALNPLPNRSVPAPGDALSPQDSARHLVAPSRRG